MTGRSSTNSFHYHWTYDAFISFRGEDTRYGFTGNLNHALTQKGLRTFFDDKEIRKGDEITPKLLKAINESRMAIIVFSENYASSTFCLDELVQICQCIKQKGRLVWPIFYDVEPSEVRHQKGKYGQALAMHTHNLRANEERIQSWKITLYEISNISGTHFDTRHDYEYEVVEKIVEEIFRITNRAPLHIAEYPVGLDSRLQNIISLLQLELTDMVIMVGICGMGGGGKTTIARALYNSVADNFEGLCFLHDVKENQKKLGLEQLQERMLSKILGVDIKIDDANEGIAIMKERLKQKKILLILDNVDEQGQLQKFAGHCDWFRSGSRIVITTRDNHLLVRHVVERKYDMEAFSYEESLDLLSWNAFKTMQVDPSYKEVVDRVICYAQGLPLALEVVGSHLCGMRKREWESALNVYERIPHEDLQNILKTSYDGLKQVEKETFLDIACFFKGSELEYVVDMVKHAHGFDPLYAIQVLADKCLIKIEKYCFSYDKFNYIEMHDLIQNMGQEIVRQESPYDVGRRSRLWYHQDIIDILEENAGTDEVRSIIIQDKSWKCIEINWDGEAFKNMKNLKILIFENVRFSESPKYLPNSLKVLKWQKYPGSFLPCGFCPKKLVVFDLAHSCLNSLEPIKKIKNLNVLNLGGCKYVTHVPDLSDLPHLKDLCLKSCENLIEIHDSVGYLAKLVTLDAQGCTQLRIVPRAIKLPSLMSLQLSDCSNLKYFPEILDKTEVTCLDLAGTGIEKLPWSICDLTSLKRLSVKGTKLPQSIFLMQRIKQLNAESCGNLVSMEEPREEVKRPRLFALDGTIELRECNISDSDLPFILTWFVGVKILDLSGNNFTTLPACITGCIFLLRLVLNNCKHLIQVEGIPLTIKHLEAVGCTSLTSESINSLLTEELLWSALTNIEDCLFLNCPEILFGISGPSINIPEWFSHQCRGSSISFWFRNEFPVASLCSVFRSTKHVVGQNTMIMSWGDYTDVVVLVNGQHVTKRRLIAAAVNHDVMLVCDLHLDDRSDEYDNMKYACRGENEWNHVKIVYQSNSKHKVIDKIGVYVITQDGSMEDVRFTDPYEKFLPKS